MSNLLRSTNLWGYNDLVTELGGDPAKLLTRFHIPTDAADNEDDFLPYRSMVLLLEASAAQLDCPDFGLRLAQWQGLDILGPIAVIARNAETVLGAFEAIARFLHLHSPALHMTLQPRTREPLAQFNFEISEPNLPQHRQAYELSLANGAQILRLLGGGSANPKRVYFPHARTGPKQAYRKAFGCPVVFEQNWCGFQLSTSVASQNIDSADPQTKRLAMHYLESQFAAGDVSLPGRVSEMIRRLLPTGLCSAETIAEHLALHPRTLQRRLATYGIRYDELLDRERREQAARYLCESGFHLSQITGLLGYAEQSTFNRSCRRWFETTPKKYRAKMQSVNNLNNHFG